MSDGMIDESGKARMEYPLGAIPEPGTLTLAIFFLILSRRRSLQIRRGGPRVDS